MFPRSSPTAKSPPSRRRTAVGLNLVWMLWISFPRSDCDIRRIRFETVPTRTSLSLLVWKRRDCGEAPLRYGSQRCWRALLREEFRQALRRRDDPPISDCNQMETRHLQIHAVMFALHAPSHRKVRPAQRWLARRKAHLAVPSLQPRRA